MKTTIQRIQKLTIAVLILLPGFISCKKQGQCVTCFPKDAQQITVNYFNSFGTISFSNTLMTTSKDSIMRVCLANADSRIYSRLNESMNSLTKDVHQTLQTILFISDRIDNNTSFADYKINAIARIRKAGKNMIYFSFYLNKGEGFVRIDDLSTDIPVLTGNSLEELFRKIVFTGERMNSLLQITDIENYDFKVKNHVDVLMKKIRKYQISNSSASLLPDEEEGNCGNTFCILTDGNRCEYRNGTYICYKRVNCFANYIKNYISNNALMSTDSISTTFDSTLHYGVRDNILSSTGFGNKYKGYYHDLSIIYGYSANISTILNTARLLYEMNTYFSYLKNNATQGNQVFLPSGMKTQIANLITEYKVIYNDNYTEQIFQDIITDISWAENKTVTQVMTKFN